MLVYLSITDGTTRECLYRGGGGIVVVIQYSMGLLNVHVVNLYIYFSCCIYYVEIYCIIL